MQKCNSQFYKERFSSLDIFFVQSTLTLGLYCGTPGNKGDRKPVNQPQPSVSNLKSYKENSTGCQRTPSCALPNSENRLDKITSSSRASRGRKFQKIKKWCIARKEFAYRMRARRPTSAMPKPFLCCERAFCCSMVLMCRGGDLTSFDVMRSVAG